jgi:hypothetical protein
MHGWKRLRPSQPKPSKASPRGEQLPDLLLVKSKPEPAASNDVGKAVAGVPPVIVAGTNLIALSLSSGAAALISRRHVNSILAFTSCRRATSDHDPAAYVSATIRRFSSTDPRAATPPTFANHGFPSLVQYRPQPFVSIISSWTRSSCHTPPSFPDQPHRVQAILGGSRRKVTCDL